MAQLGRALRSGRRGRGFESRRFDDFTETDNVSVFYFIHGFNTPLLAAGWFIIQKISYEYTAYILFVVMDLFCSSNIDSETFYDYNYMGN